MKKTLLVITLAFVAASIASAQDYRFYNQFGGQTGSARGDGMGGYRFYNQFGGQTGSARSDGMGGYRFYNQFGGQTGSLRGN